MEKAYIFLADGFEEIEGLTVVDILRRAGVEIQMVSIMGRKELTGSHGIPVVADVVFEEVRLRACLAGSDCLKAGVRPAILVLRRRLREQRCHLIRSLYAALSRPAAAWGLQFRLHWHLQSSLQGKKRQMRWQRALFMRYNAGKRKKTLAF